ncbi:MAG TPA: hypothetical protein VLA40_06430 [Rheinheimera sp.]|nr:hypothetical protein [Rheinheimera sp.]
MSTPEQFDADLKQQFQHDKARHPMPAALRKDILRQANRKKRPAAPVIWRNIQLALCCALLVVFGTVLLPTQQAGQPQYYQITYSSNSQYREIQQHSITHDAQFAIAELHRIGKQQYAASAGQTAAFHQQIGLLRQEQQQWQISVCDDLLLRIDKSLLAQLYLPQSIEKLAMQQWVEFISDESGQLMAIRPATKTMQCPGA